MDQFVCVRMVQANAMDMTLFQFDYDLTFAAFLMNPDGTIYGRFGSRSGRKEATKDMTLEGFSEALQAALDLHKRFPASKAQLAAKRNPNPQFKSPDDFPTLRGKYKPTLDYEGKIVQSCMHCHQVREAERHFYRDDRKAISDEVLYPWPMPDVVGLSLDPKKKATVATVAKGSPAERAGFKAGDEIVALQGQPLLSIADVQWVLHNATQPAKLEAEVRRGRRAHKLTFDLPAGWRRSTDIGWRATSWDLRRMAFGGILFKELSADARAKAGLKARDLGLYAEHVGEYGEHAVAKKAGIKKGDVLVAFDGRSEQMTESELFRHVLQRRMPGDRIPMTMLRDGKQMEFEIQLP